MLKLKYLLAVIMLDTCHSLSRLLTSQKAKMLKNH